MARVEKRAVVFDESKPSEHSLSKTESCGLCGKAPCDFWGLV